MKIGLDAMGGDHAPRETVKGAVAAAREHGVEVVLVGRSGPIESELKACRWELPILHANEVVGADESPAKAVRSKQDSSIVVGTNLLKNGDVNAFVSAGNTGAVAAAALFALGRIEGVERPAIGFLFSTPMFSVLMLDVGANSDCKPNQLLQFARMGSAYMERLCDIERPKIGLLSIGEEETKGNRLVRDGHALLRESGLNFVGNVEGKDMFNGTVDVVVTDGFTGNVVLKTSEGFSEFTFRLLRQKIASRPQYRIAGFFLKPAVRALTKRLEYSEYGGAPLLGVNGNVILAHGRSDANAIKNAILIAKQAQEQGVLEAITRGIT
jgi:glycerol-3-phosphate acyltransferase PlsX